MTDGKKAFKQIPNPKKVTPILSVTVSPLPQRKPIHHLLFSSLAVVIPKINKHLDKALSITNTIRLLWLE